jgi:excisionase family DNA binding protein
MHPQPTPPELLRVNEFCTRYVISRSTFYRLVKRGEIQLFKIGGATRVKIAVAKAWAERPVRQPRV